VAGNTAASIDSPGFMIDLTDPSVAITSPADGLTTIALSVQVKGTASDTPSGIATVTVNGRATDNAASWTTSTTVNLNCGVNTLTALATDQAGRTNTASMTVTRLCFGIQYAQPLDETTGSQAPVENDGKYGRVIPVKVIVSAATGAALNNVYFTANGLALQIGVNGASCSSGGGSDAIEAYADAGQSSGGSNLFRWASSSENSWIYNLDTKSPPGMTMATNSCYRLDVYVSDGANKVKISTTTYALFKPTK
jgi:hypothetical protein